VEAAGEDQTYVVYILLLGLSSLVAVWPLQQAHILAASTASAAASTLTKNVGQGRGGTTMARPGH
jgi:hypothetical protein